MKPDEHLIFRTIPFSAAQDKIVRIPSQKISAFRSLFLLKTFI